MADSLDVPLIVKDEDCVWLLVTVLLGVCVVELVTVCDAVIVPVCDAVCDCVGDIEGEHAVF